MIKTYKLEWLAALLLGYSHFSLSSDIVFGQSLNAAQNGSSWVMTNVLPQQMGLEVTNIFYRYTAIKNTDDKFIVTVSNEDTSGEGYIFRSVDDWTGLPGNTIVKSLKQPAILGSRFGDGSIQTEGTGEVFEPIILYSYRYDPCFNPQSSPSCEGFIPEIPEVPDVENPLDNDFIQDEIDRKRVTSNEDEEEEDRERLAREETEEEKESLETLLGISSLSALAATDNLRALTGLSVLPSTYTVALPSPVMQDTVVLKEEVKLRSGSRRLQYAQDKLHQELVKSQFK